MRNVFLQGLKLITVIPLKFEPFLDKSDPIEKSKVVVQFPSAERFKPSYVHRCVIGFHGSLSSVLLHRV